MKTIVCLPCYNEAAGLPELLDRFARLRAALPMPLELVAVDDGSSDATRSILESRADSESITVRVHPRNRGLGPAIITGLQAALERSDSPDDGIVCMDADNTHDPDYIPAMLDRLAQGADVVIASRFRPGSREVGAPLFRRALSRVARWLFALTLPTPGVRDYTCGFRAYRAGLIRQAFFVFGDHLIERRGFACTDEVLIKLSTLTEAIAEIPFVLRYDKKQGPSALPLGETILATFKLIHHGRAMRRRIRNGQHASAHTDQSLR